MWMVRAGPGGFLIDRFEKENKVVIGWSIGDLTNVESLDEIKNLLRKHYPNENEGSIGINASQISRFRFDIQKGDYVVSYNPSNQVYLVGEITSDYKFNDKFYLDTPLEYCDTRDVKWIGKINRNDLSKSTQNTLGTINTIFKIKTESAVEILDYVNNHIERDPTLWIFTINKSFYFELKDKDKFIWNSAKEVRKDDLILIYVGKPYSSISFILKVTSDPFEDPEIRRIYKTPAVNVEKISELSRPIKLSELREHPILKNFGAVKANFIKSHWKMTKDTWQELKNLILEKNPKLTNILGERSGNGITKYLKKIFRSYKKARENRERVQGHELSTLFNIEFPNLVKTIINVPEITDNKHFYDAKGGYHARGVFIKHPWIIFSDKNTLEKDENGASNYNFYVMYLFNEDMSGFYLSLNIKWGYANPIFEKNPDWNKKKRDEYLKSCASGIRENLEKDIEIPLDFQEAIDNSPWATTTILGKYYNAKQLPSENNLRDDLGRILKIYNHLIQDSIIPKPYKIIQTLFKEFKTTYLPIQEGFDHTTKYEKERQKVTEYIKMINEDNEAIYNFDDPPINHLLPIKEPSVAPVAVGDIRAFRYKDEDLPGLTIAIRDLINNLIDNESKEVQKELISTFKHSKYKKGFQTAMLTPTLYYIHPDFWFINKKTVATFNLLSKFIGSNEKISGILEEYIDNNDKLHDLVASIKEYVPELDFETFDAFCHWMSSDGLSNYANDEEKFWQWLIDNGFEKPPEYRSFQEFLNERNYLYAPETLENFLLSLKVKPFVILTGNSGTGKTKIAQLFAEYLKLKNKGNHQIIPVGANWTENRHLLGFYNVIIQDYQNTTSLDLLLNASEDENNPYFLILDEMNLSHVERYFADFLSAMESGKSIPLHSNDKDKMDLAVPERLKISYNVLVVGTVNVDETTYMFSPKVLDRANTIEFTTYSAKNYMLGEFDDNQFEGDVEYLEDPLSNIDVREAKIQDLKNSLIHVQIPEGNLWTFLAEELHHFQDTLSEARFDFGFRVIDEILRFMYVAWLYENKPDVWTNWSRYFDAQIMQKMLPKIHGSQRELDVVLEKLFKLCYNGESDNTWYLQKLDDENLLYPTSAKKLQWMGKTLQEKRFVSFTN